MINYFFNIFKFCLIRFIGLVFILNFLFFIRKDFMLFISNKIIVNADDGSGDNNLFFKILKPKIEKLMDFYFTDEIIVFSVFLIILFLCILFIFFNKSFGFLFLSFLISSFYSLQRKWEKTDSGDIFINFFDSIVIFKPLSLIDRLFIFDSIVDEKKDLISKISHEEKMSIILRKDFNNVSKEDFHDKIEDIIINNFCKKNEIQNINQDYTFSMINFSIKNIINPISDFLIHNSFQIGCLLLAFGVTTYYLGYLNNIFDLFNVFKKESSIHFFAEKNEIIVKQTGEALINLDKKINNVGVFAHQINKDLIEVNALATDTAAKTAEFSDCVVKKFSSIELKFKTIERQIDVVQDFLIHTNKDLVVSTLERFREENTDAVVNALEFTQTISSNLPGL